MYFKLFSVTQECLMQILGVPFILVIPLMNYKNHAEQDH